MRRITLNIAFLLSPYGVALAVVLLLSCTLAERKSKWKEYPGECKLPILNEISTAGFSPEEKESFQAIDELFAWYRAEELAGRQPSSLEVFPRMEGIVARGHSAIQPLREIIRMGNRHSMDQIWERPEISYYRMAALMLGRLKAAEAVDDLMIMATRRGLKESRLRAPGVKALGDIGDPRAIPVIEKALEDHSEQVRQAAKRALEQLQRPQR